MEGVPGKECGVRFYEIQYRLCVIGGEDGAVVKCKTRNTRERGYRGHVSTGRLGKEDLSCMHANAGRSGKEGMKCMGAKGSCREYGVHASAGMPRKEGMRCV